MYEKDEGAVDFERVCDADPAFHFAFLSAMALPYKLK